MSANLVKFKFQSLNLSKTPYTKRTEVLNNYAHIYTVISY